MTSTSLWHDRTPWHAPAVQADVDLAGPWDVVVVGAGLTGLTTALLLGRAGKRVLVLEARQVGAGATGSSTAKVSLLQGTRLSSIRRHHPASTVARYVEANREGQAWVERFCDEHGVGLAHAPAYTYGHGRVGAARARREHDVARDAGLPVSWTDQVDLPFPTSGAVRLDDQVQLDPMELLGALAAEAVRHGVVVVEGVRVLKVRGSSPVRVTTYEHEVRTERLVLATNMPILDRGAFFSRMTPARSYGLAYRTDAEPVGAMYLSADQPSRSLRDAVDQDGQQLLLVGGSGHTTGRSTPTSAHVDELRTWTAEHFPGARETHAWSAQDFVPHHQLPFAGPLLPGSDHLLMAGGYAKWGMTNAVAASLALSSRILGGHTEWADAFATWSPHELRGLPASAKMNAEVGIELARGWLPPLRRTSRSKVCTHLGGVTTWNDAESSWDCPLHGSRFDADGSVLDGPAVCGLRHAEG
ncbi:FAD-dependent oxidoreductase [Nocardioides conyzicola]|uniref:FAD-dependent oxidoreductase n=1 Tax=Nocardioides conyzicola TaxID=1651781 RepID=A0ABP8XVZ1_9ACTN